MAAIGVQITIGRPKPPEPLTHSRRCGKHLIMITIATTIFPIETQALYQLCWHLGASQGDIASLKGEDLDWQNGTVSFTRKKTGVPAGLDTFNARLSR